MKYELGACGTSWPETTEEFPSLQGHKRERFRSYSSTLYFRQCAMHKMDRDRTLANGGRDPLHVSGADVSNCKNCWQACLKHLRRSSKRPFLWSACQNWIQVPSCKNEALLIKDDTATQPVAPR